MIVAITGTPGTGKTAVSAVLQNKRFRIIDLNKTIIDNSISAGIDKSRNSKIVDVKKLDKYIKNRYTSDDVFFIEGHLSHLLKCVDKVIVFRCHPDELKKRLLKKGWNEEKIDENLEAEILDVILCESLEKHSKDDVFEIDTTKNSVEDVADCVVEIVENDFKPMNKYNTGNIDWSEEILRRF